MNLVLGFLGGLLVIAFCIAIFLDSVWDTLKIFFPKLNKYSWVAKEEENSIKQTPKT
ncbi:MAG: hypothetical protein FWF63_00435 [Fibromonadales bacterium]|nr:hypothetical protein [Fibromonadales bacterium]